MLTTKTEIINGIAERIGVSPPELHLLNNPVGLKTAYSSGPSYDSGWISLAQNQTKTLFHNLGGNSDTYVVDMQYKTADSGINHRYYGGADFGSKTTLGAPNDRVGAYWRSLTPSTITVYRRPEDTYVEQARIRIWADNTPDYDSGWRALSAGAAATTLIHNLGGDTDNYVLDMQYKSVGSGVNQRYYGGADFKANTTVGNPDDQVGAYWRSLSNTSVTVYRRPQDTYAEEVRIRLWIRPTPTYDSGWVAVNPDQSIIR